MQSVSSTNHAPSTQLAATHEKLFRYFLRYEQEQAGKGRVRVQDNFERVMKNYLFKMLTRGLDPLITEFLRSPASLASIRPKLVEMVKGDNGPEELLKLDNQLGWAGTALKTEFNGLRKFGVGTYMEDYPFTAALFRHQFANVVSTPSTRIMALDITVQVVLRDFFSELVRK